MLRENLDTVLKELLEFKKNEKVPTIYPGSHLDVNGNFLTITQPSICSSKSDDMQIDVIVTNSKEIMKSAEMNNVHESKAEIINRIRRYLDEKSKQIKKPLSNVKLKLYEKLKNHKKKYLDRPNQYNKTRIYEKKSRHSTLYNDYKANKPLKRVKRKEIIDELFSMHGDTHTKIDDDPAKGDAVLKARFLFKSCMNHEILHARGHQPLLDLLDILGGWPILKLKWNAKNFDWLELMAKLRLYNNDILISEWVGPDIKNSDEFVIQFDQTSLGTYYENILNIYLVYKY